MTEKLSSGHSVEEFKGEEADGLKKRFFLYSDGVMRLHPGGFVLPTNYTKYAHKIHNFEVKPTDTFVTGFPKSGTMWLQEIVWNLLLNPNLDHPKANSSIDEKFPFLEGDMYVATTGASAPDPDGKLKKRYEDLYPGKSIQEGLFVGLAAGGPSPRFIKSHLPLSLLPKDTLKTAKIVHIVREPRDVISSFYHFARLQILMGYEGNLDQFVEDAVNDRIPYAPYWKLMKEAWEMRDHPNFCLLFYEDLKNDPIKEIKRIDKFLGTKRTDKEIDNVIRFTSFDSMKERFKKNQPTFGNVLFKKEVEEKEGGFFRKGKIGDWKDRFTPEQIKKLNVWIEKNLTQFGKNFKYKV